MCTMTRHCCDRHRTYLHLFATLVTFALFSTARAQDYPQKDDDGNTIYYKIFSASPLYEGMCLQDNTRTDTKYPFGLANHEIDNKYQEWTLVPGNADGYYQLRNRGTFRYVATNGSWQAAFFAINYSAKANTDNEILLTPQGDGQMTMTYLQGTTTQFLLVGDTDKGPEIFEKKGHKNTTRAWIIYPSNSIPSDISTASSNQVSIQAVGRRIVVSGTRYYDVYDIQGRPVDNESELLPGVYVVEAAGIVKNVLIK
ncbi:MAG: hypothetical protein ACI4B5_05455 [Bacteroidaceae bacterium]